MYAFLSFFSRMKIKATIGMIYSNQNFKIIFASRILGGNASTTTNFPPGFNTRIICQIANCESAKFRNVYTVTTQSNVSFLYISSQFSMFPTVYVALASRFFAFATRIISFDGSKPSHATHIPEYLFKTRRVEIPDPHPTSNTFPCNRKFNFLSARKRQYEVPPNEIQRFMKS